MSIELDQFHEVFFTESLEALDAMESALLRLAPGAADPETVNTIFRVAHSIKGGAGMFGFTDVAAFTHTLETLLDELRAGRLAVTAPICEGLLQSVDQIRLMMAAIQKHQQHDPTVSRSLQEMFNAVVAGAAAPLPAPALPATVHPVSHPPAGQDEVTWRIRFRALPELLNRGNDPLRMFDELAGIGRLEVRADQSALPPLETMELSRCYLEWELLLHTTKPRESIDLVFEWAEGDCELLVERAVAVPAVSTPEPAPVHPAAAAETAAQPAARAAAQQNGSHSEVNSIRVAIEKIDELLNAVGEIVITQSMLSQLATRLDGVHGDRLRTGLAQLENHVRELQESVMRVRMLPVGSVFTRFPRMVRDLSNRLGKQIRLQISGEQTELDKTVLERIGDPLVHLVRNSVDHGIEDPAQRLAAGKPAEGTVHLNAFHKGGSIHIVISDDGKGLDKDRILEKAQSKGLIEAGAVLTDEQVYELIFLPGFSTASQTTDLSGRGVGMDVVRRNIKELGGHVELRSELGTGTTTTITLPLTLAIVDGQTVLVGSETYIVPLVTIVESLQLRANGASVIHGHGEVFSFRGEYLPIIRLHDVFGVEPRSRQLTDGLVMVVEGDGRRAGLFIDELLGQQQVVIKSMEANYTRIEGIGGATILGEGAVALILDVPGLMRMSAPVPVRPLRTGT